MRIWAERWKFTLKVAGVLLAIGLATADAYVDLVQPADVCRVRQALWQENGIDATHDRLRRPFIVVTTEF